MQSSGINECPRSYITNDSKWLLEQIGPARAVHKATGASLYGPDSGRWPGYWFDAVAALAVARDEAEVIEMSD